MIRIVGKFFLNVWAVLILCTAVTHCSITMRVTDNQSRILDEVGIGQPFMIEVVLNGDAASQGEPTIEGLESIHGFRCGYHMKSINSVSSVTYTYRARVDREGEYILGPARVGHHHAPALTIVATSEAKARAKKHEKKEKVLLQFLINKNDVVVGEKIGCCLRFLYAEDGTALKSAGQQELAGFAQSAVQGPVAGTQEIDGHTYQSVQWCWDIFPQTAGEFVLPAHYADYTVQTARQGIWAHFGALMHANDLKRLYSNGHAVTVRSLEDAPYPVCAIGRNITVHASLDSSTINQSDAVVLSIDVSGDFCSQSPCINELKGAPAEIKWYRSQLIPIDAHHVRAEFILQGIKSGEYEIPAQKMCYFDVDNRDYVIIETQPLSLTVLPSLNQTQEADEQENTLVSSDEEQKAVARPCLALSSGSFIVASRGWSMPWWLFLTMLGMSAVYFLVPFRALYCLVVPSSKNRYKNAFIVARSRLEKAQKNHDPRQIYAIFNELLSVRCSIPLEQISIERIDHEFYNRFVDQETRLRWNNFINQALECSFGKNQATGAYDALFVSAFDWLERLKKIV